jgi:outer membrane protein TolC
MQFSLGGDVSPIDFSCICTVVMRFLVGFLAVAPLCAQAPLSLRDAVRLAMRENKTVAAAASGASATESRVAQARAGALPKLNYSESFTRGDNPVFVFSSLLTQHQFGPDNFNVGPLNRPDPLNNFQSQLSLDQVLYDAGRTRTAVASARLSGQIAMEDRRLVEMQAIAGVVRAYYGVLLASQSLTTAEQALRSAEADLKRADSVRAAGMSTDVDVLSIRVHLAGVMEQRIQRAADLDVAKAQLNDTLGAAPGDGALPDHGHDAVGPAGSEPGEPGAGSRGHTPRVGANASRRDSREHTEGCGAECPASGSHFTRRLGGRPPGLHH